MIVHKAAISTRRDMCQQQVLHSAWMRSSNAKKADGGPRWHVGRFSASNAMPPSNGDKGIVDHVYVQDWGQEDEKPDFDAGDLKARGPVRRVLDYSTKNGLSFPETVSNFLAESEQMNRFERSRIARPNIPPFERWAFQEEHYEQYLVDLEQVHSTMAEAVERARHAIRSVIADNHNAEEWVIDPVGLGIYRGDCIRKDIKQLRATRPSGIPDPELQPSACATEYAHVLRSIGIECSTCSLPDDLRTLASRLCAHIYMISVSQIAIGNRIGSVCVEKIDLVQRDAAHTYLDYSCEHPPQKVIRDALNTFGQTFPEPMKEAFFDELLIATEHTSLLIDSLARES